MLTNDDIRIPEVRVVGVNGEPLGIMSGKDAHALADKANLDLVLIAPQAAPPVCRIMDYGKFRFEQSKREKDQRKNQQHTLLKEVRLSLNIDTHDFNTKVGHAVKFLKAGDKVKVTIRFKGREVTHLDLGRKLMEKFKEACSDVGVSDEKPSKLEGRFYAAIIHPKTDKTVKSKDSVKDAVKDSVKDAVKGSVEDSATGSVKDASKGSVKDSAKGSVKDSAKGSVKDTSKGSVKDTVKDKHVKKEEQHEKQD